MSGPRGPGELHPFLKIDGETLPPGCFRNVEDLLVRGAASFTVAGEDLRVLDREIRFLKEHVLIARTDAGDLTREAEDAWMDTLRQRARPGTVLGHQRAGSGLLYIRFDNSDTTRRILHNPMHQFHGGAVAYQPWIQEFNPRHPKGLLTPFWISFPSLPLEYLKLAHKVAEQVGKILAEDINLERVHPARFCVGIDITHGWVSSVVGHSTLGGSVIIPVAYEGFELQCSFCGHHAHRSAQCPRVQPNTPGAHAAPYAPQHPEIPPQQRQPGILQCEPSTVIRA